MSETTKAIRDAILLIIALISMLGLYSIAALVWDDPTEHDIPAEIDGHWRDQ